MFKTGMSFKSEPSDENLVHIHNMLMCNNVIENEKKNNEIYN